MSAILCLQVLSTSRCAPATQKREPEDFIEQGEVRRTYRNYKGHFLRMEGCKKKFSAVVVKEPPLIAALPRHLVSATRLRCIHQLPHLLAHQVIYPQRARTCFHRLVAEGGSSGIGEILRQRPSALARTGSKSTNHDLKSARAARASSPDDLPAARRITDLPQLRGCIFWCALGRKEKELPRD